MNITWAQRGYANGISRHCGQCGAPASARTPRGFACIECAMEEFYVAAEEGDHSWFPLIFKQR